MSASTLSIQPLFPRGSIPNAPRSLQYCNNFADQPNSQDTGIHPSNEPCIPLTYTEKLIHFQHLPTTTQILFDSVMTQDGDTAHSSSSTVPTSAKDAVTSLSSIEGTSKGYDIGLRFQFVTFHS
jgi:hypothetical protein